MLSRLSDAAQARTAIPWFPIRVAGRSNDPSILAHEAAHVSLNHFRRKLAWGAIGTVAGLGIAVAGQMLISPFVPRSLELVGILVVALPLTVLRGLYDTFVVRRHEAEADEFAVDVAGAAPLVNALGVLGTYGLPTHNGWTTHSTWERRTSWIRECEESRHSRPADIS
jgi:Zn-dependent protease with chaperone function